MKIDTSFLSQPLHSSLPKLDNDKNITPNQDIDATFKDIITEMMSASEEASDYSKEKTAELLTGNLENLPDFMVAGQKSSLLFQFNLTAKNKVLEAYNEILRTQV